VSWSRVGAGNLGVSESSRPAQIELAEISLRGRLLDACAPCIGTPRYHNCQTVKVLAKRNESTPVSEFFASSACPIRGYRCSWMARSRRRVSYSSRIRRLGADVLGYSSPHHARGPPSRPQASTPARPSAAYTGNMANISPSAAYAIQPTPADGQDAGRCKCVVM
jgi:hypothetical protein